MRFPHNLVYLGRVSRHRRTARRFNRGHPVNKVTMRNTSDSHAFTPERNTSDLAHRSIPASPPQTIRSIGKMAKLTAALCDGMARINLVWLLVIFLAMDLTAFLNGFARGLAQTAFSLFLVAAIIGKLRVLSGKRDDLG